MRTSAGTTIAARIDTPERARWVGPTVTAAGAATIGLASFMPWLRTGHATRNSFQMLHTAALLDVVTGAAAAALRLWYLVPVFVALVWLAAALDRPRLMVVLAVGLAVAAGGVAVVVLRSGVATGLGPGLALLAAVPTLAGALLTSRPPRSPT